jgi:protein-tyrosine phosphatase
MITSPETRVLFVCLGNICRSPTAHGVMLQRLATRQLGGRVAVDSCGTGAWHAGEPPDRRATAAARNRGYDLAGLRARQLVQEDFDRFDYILAMDRANLSELRALCPPGFSGHLGLFLEFAANTGVEEVPDPYYGAGDGFARVLDLIEQACDGLLEGLARAPSA